MREIYDAVVVGAGPAGSSFGALLAEKGASVLLLDKEKFPRDKPCGDAVGGKALNVLAELGLREVLKKAGFLRSAGIVFSSPNGSEVEIPLLSDAKEISGGFVCKRSEFDSILFQNAKKKCSVLESTEAVDLILENGKAIGVKARGSDGKEREYFGKVIVGADGANSLVARKAGVFRIEPAHSCSAVRAYYLDVGGLRGNIEIHFLPECMPGYFWIFPLSSHEANVGAGMLLSDITKGKLNLSRLLGECMKSKRFAARFGNAKRIGNVRGWSLPLASAKRKCAGNGWLLLGDAASLIDPFSGEGIGNGMKSAKIAADVIGKALKKGEVKEEDCLQYERELWQEIGADVQSSYRMQKLGKHSFLLNFIIGKAKKCGWVRGELAGMIANREAKRKASDPMFYLRMIFA